MIATEVMRKALEALENCTSEHGHRCSRCDSEVDPNGEAITALRAEIERLDAVEPVAWVAMNGVRRVALHLTSADASADRDRRQLSNDLSGNLTAHWVAPLYTAPIAPSIPALTDEDVRTELTRQYDEDGGAHFLKLADWAYALAAERAGVQIK